MLQQGPIAVLMDASQFHLYESGIMVFEKCNHVTHAIVATGWDSDAQGEFLRRSRIYKSKNRPF